MLRRVFAILAYVIGITGAGLFMVFVLGSGTGCLPCADAPSEGFFPWINNLVWLLLFALQHSGMARQSYKNFIVQWIPVSIERSTYVMMSGIAASLLALNWEPLSGEPIWQGELAHIAPSLLGIAAVVTLSIGFDHAAFFGLTNMESPGRLRTDGPYRYVRHPLMLALLLAIWGQPIMPRELFLLNFGMTLYILVAIRLEERDLVRVFGKEYEHYQRRVPALIPMPKRFPV